MIGEPLTDRELCILWMASKGKTFNEISRICGFKDARAVSNVLRHTFCKLAVRSITEAVAQALRLGKIN